MTRLFVILLTLLMASCSNEEYDVVDNTSSTQEVEMENFDFLIGKFSLSLAKVFSENEDVRKLIKEEALKQFDYDYDVLYLLVNDKPLAEGITLEKLLLQYLTVEEISSLIHKMPTLTIYVPSLPEDTFSAESWNVQQDIPFVAYKNEKNQILYVDHKGTVDMIQCDEIPVFPIVVIKPSDRVALYPTNVRSATTPTILRAGNGMNFVFEYEDFNNKSRINTRATPIPDNYKKIYDAKKKSDENGIWQRDYIYYNISTKDGTGVFQKNISECLYSFELLGDPNAIYRVVADQDDDPRHRPEGLGRRPGGGSWGTEKYWYAGNFEFIVKIYVSSTQLTSNEIIKAISINPTDLFELELQKQGSGRNSNPMRVVGIKKMKKYYFPQPLPLFDWNIENYSASIKVSIEERDNKVTEQNTIETSSTFATNFEFNASLGEKIKVGAKYGASSSITQKVATTITRYLDSDPLGDVVINFGDDVVVKNVMDSIGRRPVGIDRPVGPPRGEGRRVTTYEPIYAPAFNPKYSSGYYRIEVAPLAQY